uniref:Bm11798 n=1 Tax=Brugia malayi TaxID=6279 RepID=A0A1I9G9R3_BRUMA|nr:Bm11798 [Brugia malayi]
MPNICVTCDLADHHDVDNPGWAAYGSWPGNCCVNEVGLELVVISVSGLLSGPPLPAKPS